MAWEIPSHQCGLGSIPGSPVFLLPQEPTSPISNSASIDDQHENQLKALVSEDTLLRTHCCPWCVLGCANWETFVADTKCFWTKSKTFFGSRTQNLCPQQMLSAWANGETFVSPTMCLQQCVLVCQGLKAHVAYSRNIVNFIVWLSKEKLQGSYHHSAPWARQSSLPVLVLAYPRK